MKLPGNKLFILLTTALAMSLPLTSLASAGADGDTLARVGDQVITLSQIDTMINSSSFVGMDIPPVGGAERERARIVTLDKVISANLLYLDALDKKLGTGAAFQSEIDRFFKNILAGLYRDKVLIGEIAISPEEVQDYITKNFKDDVDITDDIRLAVESVIRKEKQQGLVSSMRQRLRQGLVVAVRQHSLAFEGDATRGDDQLVAVIGRDDKLTWGEVKNVLVSSGDSQNMDERMQRLDSLIDDHLMTSKALEQGLDKDPVFLARIAEFKKAKLINQRRGQVLAGLQPSIETLEKFYQANRERIIHPESRELQMVVLQSKEEALKVQGLIESGAITIHEAAQQYSIDPNAKRTLGVSGFVSKGTGFPALDQLAFSLEKDKLGGPVQSEAGWHLVQVLTINPAQYTDFTELNTQQKTQRIYVQEKLSDYVINLRQNKFPVEVNREALLQ